MRRIRCFPCRTNEILFVIFITWSIFFVGFWIWPTKKTPLPRTCSPNNEYVPYLSSRTFKKKSLEITPVYIVEEHHEVLPYWFQSAHIGLTRKEGNVLLHIDGHSDASPLTSYENISLFKYPTTIQDIVNLMQQNDVFIAGAAQAGLLSRYIWVWPPWESSIAREKNDHIQVNVEIGLLKDPVVDKRYPACACIEFLSTSRWQNLCVQLTESLRENGTAGNTIQRERCRIKRKALVEILSEDRALELSRSDSWLSLRDNIILDIDEDYYGCEAAIMPLLDAGMSETQCDTISDLVSEIFCPKNVYSEKRFNHLFYDLIQKIKMIRDVKSRFGGHVRDRIIFFKNETRIIYKEFTRILELAKVASGLCNSEVSTGELVRYLVKYLANLGTSQLTALAKVSLCLNVSPRTSTFDPKRGMRLCIGYNRPNNSMVHFHTPNMNEIEIRTDNLKKLLLNVPTPSLVTICRSTRDGYTPLKYFNKIEHDIIDVLKSAYYKITPESIHYDSNLLGGKDGLVGRHFIPE